MADGQDLELLRRWAKTLSGVDGENARWLIDQVAESRVELLGARAQAAADAEEVRADAGRRIAAALDERDRAAAELATERLVSRERLREIAKHVTEAERYEAEAERLRRNLSEWHATNDGMTLKAERDDLRAQLAAVEAELEKKERSRLAHSKAFAECHLFLVEKEKRLAQAEEALRRILVNETSQCRYDHGGACQEHWLERDCCIAAARAYFATPAATGEKCDHGGGNRAGEMCLDCGGNAPRAEGEGSTEARPGNAPGDAGTSGVRVAFDSRPTAGPACSSEAVTPAASVVTPYTEIDLMGALKESLRKSEPAPDSPDVCKPGEGDDAFRRLSPEEQAQRSADLDYARWEVREHELLREVEKLARLVVGDDDCDHVAASIDLDDALTELDEHRAKEPPRG